MRALPVACEETSHQAITKERDLVRMFEAVDAEFVGCTLCMHVCPFKGCISMDPVDYGSCRNWTAR